MTNNKTLIMHFELLYSAIKVAKEGLNAINDPISEKTLIEIDKIIQKIREL